MMTLREKLTKPKGTKTVSEYFQNLRSVIDELALVNSPVSEDDLVIHALNEIRSDFKQIVVSVRARESFITFEELLDKFTDYEEVIKKQESSTDIIILSAHHATKPISSHSDLPKHFRPSHNTWFASLSTFSKHSSSTNFKTFQMSKIGNNYQALIVMEKALDKFRIINGSAGGTGGCQKERE
ncbi:Uncharacterized protein TCM_025658 [Theobroma cacao]|uniref:Uncharacterized protein n=1 Tax=Theobroma cacao TaxID=3641 RepID=A0A061F0T9_THECC|nr:Uncharacterized protein TCM_025658 [Theobroma cacao]